MGLEMYKKITSLVKQYPVVSFSLCGLLIGSVFHWLLGESSTGHLIWFAVLMIGGAPIVWSTVKGVLNRKFAADIVAMLAIVVSIITYDPFPGVIIVLMQSGGKALEDHAFHWAQNSLNEMTKRYPKSTIRKHNGRLDEINVTDVKPGEILVIRTGDLIPVDGIVKKDLAEIDESSLTGEPLIRTKKLDESVFSGTVNVGKPFEMEAKKTSKESQYAKIVEMVRKAQQEKAPLQRLADRYAVWFTPVVITISLLGWVMTHNTATILAVLVVATPCPLIFATPAAIISGINRSAKNNIVVKTGSAMEQIGKAKAVLFDKTGTITFGSPRLEEMKLVQDNIDFDNLLYKICCIEQMSSHPTARSVLDFARGKFDILTIPERFHEVPGAGVEGYIDTQHIVIGSENVFAKINPKLREEIKNAQLQFYSSGKMLAYVTINGNLFGVLIFGDLIRPGISFMMDKLKKLGILQTILLTGDNYENANDIARKIRISKFHAKLFPEQKVEFVKKARDEFGNVAMVGDGINDAPALATATVGIAMGARGTAISAETSDIVFLVDDVTRVADIVNISQRTVRIAKQGIFFGLGVSFVLMGFASLGHIEPEHGALFQEILDIAVILNALRAR